MKGMYADMLGIVDSRVGASMRSIQTIVSNKVIKLSKRINRLAVQTTQLNVHAMKQKYTQQKKDKVWDLLVRGELTPEVVQDIQDQLAASNEGNSVLEATPGTQARTLTLTAAALRERMERVDDKELMGMQMGGSRQSTPAQLSARSSVVEDDAPLAADPVDVKRASVASMASVASVASVTSVASAASSVATSVASSVSVKPENDSPKASRRSSTRLSAARLKVQPPRVSKSKPVPVKVGFGGSVKILSGTSSGTDTDGKRSARSSMRKNRRRSMESEATPAIDEELKGLRSQLAAAEAAAAAASAAAAAAPAAAAAAPPPRPAGRSIGVQVGVPDLHDADDDDDDAAALGEDDERQAQSLFDLFCGSNAAASPKRESLAGQLTATAMVVAAGVSDKRSCAVVEPAATAAVAALDIELVAPVPQSGGAHVTPSPRIVLSPPAPLETAQPAPSKPVPSTPPAGPSPPSSPSPAAQDPSPPSPDSTTPKPPDSNSTSSTSPLPAHKKSAPRLRPKTAVPEGGSRTSTIVGGSTRVKSRRLTQANGGDEQKEDAEVFDRLHDRGLKFMRQRKEAAQALARCVSS